MRPSQGLLLDALLVAGASTATATDDEPTNQGTGITEPEVSQPRLGMFTASVAGEG